MEHITPPLSPSRKEMPPIVLTLAVNYIPAVACLAKAVLISFCLCVLNPGTHLGGFIVFAMLLNIDRAVSCSRIFDENAVQLCILAAWVINYLRVASEAPKFLNPAVSVLWLACSVALVVEPKSVQEFLVLYGQGSGGVLHKIVPAVVTSLMVAGISYTPLAIESGIVKSARAVGFACFCVAWVYIVSVWRAKPRHAACVFETHALIARFCPLLYVNSVVAVMFSLVCLGGLAYHYVKIHVRKGLGQREAVDEIYKEPYKDYKEPCSDVYCDVYAKPPGRLAIDHNGVDASEMATIDEEDDEALEACFRSSCQSRQA